MPSASCRVADILAKASATETLGLLPAAIAAVLGWARLLSLMAGMGRLLPLQRPLWRRLTVVSALHVSKIPHVRPLDIAGRAVHLQQMYVSIVQEPCQLGIDDPGRFSRLGRSRPTCGSLSWQLELHSNLES